MPFWNAHALREFICEKIIPSAKLNGKFRRKVSYSVIYEGIFDLEIPPKFRGPVIMSWAKCYHCAKAFNLGQISKNLE